MSWYGLNVDKFMTKYQNFVLLKGPVQILKYSIYNWAGHGSHSMQILREVGQTMQKKSKDGFSHKGWIE